VFRPVRALPREAGDHGSAVSGETVIADAVCPDDGAEPLPQRFNREQFGVLVLDCPAEPGHEGALAFGVPGELLVPEPDQVADPGAVLAAPEADDCGLPVVDDPVARLVVTVREVQATGRGVKRAARSRRAASGALA
jgi:hypothetical protein